MTNYEKLNKKVKVGKIIKDKKGSRIKVLRKRYDTIIGKYLTPKQFGDFIVGIVNDNGTVTWQKQFPEKWAAEAHYNGIKPRPNEQYTKIK